MTAAGAPTSSDDGRPPRSALVLLALVTGAIVSNINLGIANVALPTIGADLGATQDQLTSIANAFALGLASTVLYLGTIGDRYGRKLLFVAGCVLTVPTSMLAAWAPNPEFLTVARFAAWRLDAPRHWLCAHRRRYAAHREFAAGRCR